MNQWAKTLWINALRSGRYTPGRGHLYQDGKHDVLGVLCDVLDPQGWSEKKRGDIYLHRHKVCFPGEAVRMVAGLHDEDMRQVAWQFDHHLDFKMIAAYIESEL